jgi:hypothetical protein
MGARHARIEELIHEHEKEEEAQGPSTSEEYRAAISAELNESVRSAHRLAAEGLAKFPDDQELLRLSRLLNLPPGSEALRLFTPDPDYGFLWHPLPPAKEVAAPTTPEEYLAGIHLYLNHASLRRAQRLAAEGHARFPDHPELERKCRLLTRACGPRLLKRIPAEDRSDRS